MRQRLLSRPWLLEVLLVGILTAGALALRLYRLSDIPPGFQGDEGAFGLEAQKIAHGELLGVWTPVTLGHATGHLYWTAFLFKLAGSSVFMVRLAMALLGTFTVPVAYLLFRLLFSARVGFLAAALIAFSFWHLVYSRAGWTIVPAVFLLLLSLYLFFLGWRRGRWLLFVIGGIFLGFGFYTHKNFPFYYAGVWIFLLPRVHFGASFTERRGTLLFLIASLLVAIPFLVFFFQHQEVFTARLKIESFFERPPYQAAHGIWEKATVVGGRIKEVLLYVHNPVPRDHVDGTGGKALLDRVSESLFWLGFLITVVRIRRPAYQLVLVGLLAGVVPALLVVTGEQRRLMGAMPFVMVCIALGIDTGLQILSWSLTEFKNTGIIPFPPWEKGGWRDFYQAVGRGAAGIALAGFLAFFSFTNITYYFRAWANDSTVKWVYVYDFVTAIDYLKTLDQDTYVYFYSDRWSYNYETRQFLLPGMKGEDRSKEFGRAVNLERINSGKVVYILMRDYTSLALKLAHLYPWGNYHEVRDSDGSLIFAAYVLG